MYVYTHNTTQHFYPCLCVNFMFSHVDAKPVCHRAMNFLKWHNRHQTSLIGMLNIMQNTSTTMAVVVVDLNQMSTCSFIKIRTRNGNFRYTITIYIDGDHFIWWHFTPALHVVVLLCVSESPCLSIFLFVWKTNGRIPPETIQRKKTHWAFDSIQDVCWSAPQQQQQKHTHNRCRSCVENKIHFINSILPLNCSCITDLVNWMHIAHLQFNRELSGIFLIWWRARERGKTLNVELECDVKLNEPNRMTRPKW